MTPTPKNTLALKPNLGEDHSSLQFDTPEESAGIVICPADSVTTYFRGNKALNTSSLDLNLSISTMEPFPLTSTTALNNQNLTKTKFRNGTTKKKTQPIYKNPLAELKKITDQILAIKIHESNKINLFSNRLGELRKQIPRDAIEDIERGNVLHKSFLEILKQNQIYQEDRVRLITTEIKHVDSLILQNDFKKAQSKWNKIQSAKKDLSDGILKKISKIEGGTKKSYYNFRDSTLKENSRKKETLINEMLSLETSAIHGAEKINQLKHIQNCWKIIGTSQNERKLWAKFKQASDTAYKSCKEYFEKRSELRISNAKEKSILCDVLDEKLTALRNQKTDIKSITLLLRDIETSWRKYSPVDDSKAKDLNKRYYRLTSSLRNIRKDQFKTNETFKRNLISQAGKLSTANPEAKNQIKALQTQWKDIKSAGTKSDEILWIEFQKICSTFFQKSPAQKKAPQIDTNEKKLFLLLDSFKALANASLLDLEKPQHKATELRHELKSLLETYRGGNRNLITRQLRGYQHQIDLKISALPNSKQREALNLIISANQYLEGLENQLFDTSNNETYSSAFNQINSQEIPSFQLPYHPPSQEALRSRTQNLKQISNYDGFLKATAESEQEMRLLCVEIELMMGLKTPEEDQKIRTEMNLQQLKQMFGKEKPSKAEIIKNFQQNYLTIKASGPLPSRVKTRLQARYENTLLNYLSNSSF